MALDPQTRAQRLLVVATGIFINRDGALEQEKDQRAILQGKMQAQILAGAFADPPQHQRNQGSKGTWYQAKDQVGPCAMDVTRPDTEAKNV